MRSQLGRRSILPTEDDLPRRCLRSRYEPIPVPAVANHRSACRCSATMKSGPDMGFLDAHDLSSLPRRSQSLLWLALGDRSTCRLGIKDVLEGANPLPSVSDRCPAL